MEVGESSTVNKYKGMSKGLGKTEFKAKLILVKKNV